MFRVCTVGVGLLLGTCCLVQSLGGIMLPDVAYAWELSVFPKKSRVERVSAPGPDARPSQSETNADYASPRRDLSGADALFEEGERTGNFLPAIEVYRKALHETPNAAWAAHAHWRTAEGYQRMRQYHEAIPHWRKTLEFLPTGKQAVGARYHLAECVFQVGRLKEALTHFRALSRTVESRRERVWSLFRSGDCLMGLGLKPEARGRYLQAQALRPDARWIPVESLSNMALLAIESNQPKRACWPIMTALSLFPDHRERPRWLYLLGEAYVRQGETAKATFVFDHVRREYPRHVEALMANVRLTTLQVSTERTSSAPNTGLSPETWTDPGHPIFHSFTNDPRLQRVVLSLGRLLSEKGDRERAFEVLLNARRGFDETTITPLINASLLQLGRVTIRQAVQNHEYTEAIRNFDTLTQCLPEAWEDPLILFYIGMSYEEMGFYDIAASLYDRTRKTKSNLSVSWKATAGLMRVELDLGRSEKALALIEDIPSDQSWRERARGLLEWAASHRGPQTAQAIGRWLREIHNGKLSPESVISLARWYMDQGAYQRARSVLEDGLSRRTITAKEGDIWAEAHCLLGEAYSHLGRPHEAMAHYERVLGREPWGFVEKWAAYRALQIGKETGSEERLLPLLKRLSQEPEGGLWRELAEYLSYGMIAVDKKETTSWS